MLIDSNHAAFEQNIDFKHGHREPFVCGVTDDPERMMTYVVNESCIKCK
jgi:ferredoxin